MASFGCFSSWMMLNRIYFYPKIRKITTVVINKKLVASFLQDFPVTGFHALCLIWCAFPTQASRSCCEGQGHGSELCMEAQQEFASSAISAARDADPLATPLTLTVPPIVPFPATHMTRLMFWGKSWRRQTSSQGKPQKHGVSAWDLTGRTESDV